MSTDPEIKEEIGNKESAIVRVNLEHTRIEKEKESLRGEMQRMRKCLAESRTQLNGMEKEINNLQQVFQYHLVTRRHVIRR